MRFLCLSDIHGHANALDAVLEEAEVRGFDQLIVCGDLCFPGPDPLRVWKTQVFDQLIVCGDLCFPGPDPLRVWKTLVARRALCVQGLGDKALARIDPVKLSATTELERSRIERLRQVHVELGEIIVTRLGQLPSMARLPLESGSTMLIVHGSPADPTEPFTMDMTDEELIALLGDEPGDVIVCGGSHVPFQRDVADIRIINVGSVGEAPGGGFANATLIETTSLGLSVTQFDVELEAR